MRRSASRRRKRRGRNNSSMILTSYAIFTSNETNQIVIFLYNRKSKTKNDIMRLSRKILLFRWPILSSLLSHRRLPVKLTGEAPSYPVHNYSILAESELTVFEKNVLCYVLVSLKITGNIRGGRG
jgi:hypothetical protein